ncbi:endolytic transglycosylase MltG [Sporomusa sp.]|uniref:endolytic transglycosylase MltG n=1 Tax=Sporomusa sp. TaxID=2078658 RepID=UPI002BAB3652|nr:endolytic transglycosylase MltG [Sporomusa sp.]HWR44911.1 endolytic transglycosylase MltG [Sporomusa sp.]
MIMLNHSVTKKAITGILAAAVIGIGTVLGWTLTQPAGNSGELRLVTIKPGTPTKVIAEELEKQSLIKNALVFRAAAKLQGVENSLQAGEYAISSDMPVRQMLVMISQGQTAYQQFTIPEGYTVDQIALLLAEKKLANAERFKEVAKNFAPFPYMTANPDSRYRVEGFIFPDTYRVAKGVTEEELLTMMVKQFDTKLTPDLRQRASEMGLSLRDVVILASLVEKEAKMSEERPVIAGVFANRVKQAMPLQSCATIQYILGYPKPELTIQDTQIISPYNTYQIMGLPPGPIANPGSAAIKAVLFADKTDYLYFVADKQGKHHFSKTYEEHLAAIDQVQI